jgi:hypothetical protein
MGPTLGRESKKPFGVPDENSKLKDSVKAYVTAKRDTAGERALESDVWRKEAKADSDLVAIWKKSDHPDAIRARIANGLISEVEEIASKSRGADAAYWGKYLIFLENLRGRSDSGALFSNPVYRWKELPIFERFFEYAWGPVRDVQTSLEHLQSYQVNLTSAKPSAIEARVRAANYLDQVLDYLFEFVFCYKALSLVESVFRRKFFETDVDYSILMANWIEEMDTLTAFTGNEGAKNDANRIGDELVLFGKFGTKMIVSLKLVYPNLAEKMEDRFAELLLGTAMRSTVYDFFGREGVVGGDAGVFAKNAMRELYALKLRRRRAEIGREGEPKVDALVTPAFSLPPSVFFYGDLDIRKSAIEEYEKIGVGISIREFYDEIEGALEKAIIRASFLDDPLVALAASQAGGSKWIVNDNLLFSVGGSQRSISRSISISLIAPLMVVRSALERSKDFSKSIAEVKAKEDASLIETNVSDSVSGFFAYDDENGERRFAYEELKSLAKTNDEIISRRYDVNSKTTARMSFRGKYIKKTIVSNGLNVSEFVYFLEELGYRMWAKFCLTRGDPKEYEKQNSKTTWPTALRGFFALADALWDAYYLPGELADGGSFPKSPISIAFSGESIEIRKKRFDLWNGVVLTGLDAFMKLYVLVFDQTERFLIRNDFGERVSEYLNAVGLLAGWDAFASACVDLRAKSESLESLTDDLAWRPFVDAKSFSTVPGRYLPLRVSADAESRWQRLIFAIESGGSKFTTLAIFIAGMSESMKRAKYGSPDEDAIRGAAEISKAKYDDLSYWAKALRIRKDVLGQLTSDFEPIIEWWMEFVLYPADATRDHGGTGISEAKWINDSWHRHVVVPLTVSLRLGNMDDEIKAHLKKTFGPDGEEFVKVWDFDVPPRAWKTVAGLVDRVEVVSPPYAEMEKAMVRSDTGATRGDGWKTTSRSVYFEEYEKLYRMDAATDTKYRGALDRAVPGGWKPKIPEKPVSLAIGSKSDAEVRRKRGKRTIAFLVPPSDEDDGDTDDWGDDDDEDDGDHDKKEDFIEPNARNSSDEIIAEVIAEVADDFDWLNWS